MIHMTIRIAYVLFLVWLGLNVLLLIVLGVVVLFGRLTASKGAQSLR